jgi:xanthine dehydrogenase YagR molybdenum-binding subunit
VNAPIIGQPVSRVDGRLKVTGEARYAAEFDPGPNLAYAVIVDSTIPNGRVASIDASAAEQAPGVLRVITHLNAPRLAYREHRAFVDS